MDRPETHDSSNQSFWFRTMPAVLMYHMLDEKLRTPSSVTRTAFQEQITALHDIGYASCTVEQLRISLLGDSFSKSEVLITFDDAYEDCIDAWEIIRHYGFGLVVFVNTDAVGKFNDWNTRSVTRRRHMSWDEIRMLHDQGVEIGSHSCSHQSLVKLSFDKLKHEIQSSKQRIESEICAEIQSFAYPYGNFNPEAVAIVQNEYAIAFTTQPTYAAGVPLEYRVPRININWKLQSETFSAAIEISPWILARTP